MCILQGVPNLGAFESSFSLAPTEVTWCFQFSLRMESYEWRYTLGLLSDSLYGPTSVERYRCYVMYIHFIHLQAQGGEIGRLIDIRDRQTVIATTTTGCQLGDVSNFQMCRTVGTIFMSSNVKIRHFNFPKGPSCLGCLLVAGTFDLPILGIMLDTRGKSWEVDTNVKILPRTRVSISTNYVLSIIPYLNEKNIPTERIR